MPNFGQGGLANAGFGIPNGAVIISLAGIFVPFIFLGGVIGCFLYFRYRRNRMLHETFAGDD